MSEMKGKVAIVTGATSGIGMATAVKFAANGMNVVLSGRNQSKLEEVAASIKSAGGNAKTVAADMTDEKDIKRLVDETVASFGRIDVLVNAAGIIANGTVQDTRLADWDYMMNLNVRGPFYLMQLCMPHLIAQRGNVVNLSSVTGIRAFPGILAYCASKAALEQMTRCVALEVAPEGVRVNNVNPGVIITELHKRSGMGSDAYETFLDHSKSTHPIGRVGTPDEVAELIFFLASPKAGFITGASHSIDGGRAQTCAR